MRLFTPLEAIEVSPIDPVTVAPDELQLFGRQPASLNEFVDRAGIDTKIFGGLRYGHVLLLHKSIIAGLAGKWRIALLGPILDKHAILAIADTEDCHVD